MVGMKTEGKTKSSITQVRKGIEELCDLLRRGGDTEEAAVGKRDSITIGSESVGHLEQMSSPESLSTSVPVF